VLLLSRLTTGGSGRLDGVCEPAHPEHWQSRDAAVAGELNAAGHRSIFQQVSGLLPAVAVSRVRDCALRWSQEEDAEGAADSAEAVESGEASGKVFYVEKGNGWKLVAAALEEVC
jgi:hypothetical protein